MLITGKLKTERVCINSFDCGKPYTLTSSCGDGSISIKCRSESKPCYDIKWPTMNTSFCQKDEGICSFENQTINGLCELDESSNLGLILGISGGALLLLIAVIGFVCFKKRKNKKDKFYEQLVDWFFYWIWQKHVKKTKIWKIKVNINNEQYGFKLKTKYFTTLMKCWVFIQDRYSPSL